MSNDKVLDKIKKCLALAASPNSNEAATALRQAQKLMAKHGITETTIADSSIAEGQIHLKSAKRMSIEETWLLSICMSVFGVKVLRAKGDLHVRIFGEKDAIEVCKYAYDVLNTQLTYATEKMRTELKLQGNSGGELRRKLGTYRKGWLSEVNDKVEKLHDPKMEESIDRVMRAAVGNVKLKSKTTRYSVNHEDANVYEKGRRDGEKASLNRAMSGSQQQARIGN